MRIITRLNTFRQKNNLFKSLQYVIWVVLCFSSLEGYAKLREITFTHPDKRISSIFINDECDNVTNGGQIQGNESGCNDPVFDPSIITNVVLPSGGTGDLEYIWISTTDDPSSSFVTWSPIPGSTASSYDPGPITQTTYFRRCARRSGCVDYIAESNIIEKKIFCCDNITNGGIILENQNGCAPSYTPNLLASLILPSGGTGELEYLWFQSTVGPPFLPDSPNWTAIPNSNSPEYAPAPISQTTYFIRCSRRVGCTTYAGKSNIVTITIQPKPSIFNIQTTHPTCQGRNNGSISVQVQNGNPPYTYAWSNGASNTPTLQNLFAGNYSLTVTDSNGCFDQVDFNLSEPPSLNAEIIATDIACSENTGTAVATPTGGTPPYTYLWSDANMQTTATATGLTAGNYFVLVTDANDCTATAEVSIENQSNLDINILASDLDCFGDSDGSAMAMVTGGVSPYQYLWNNNQTTASINNLAAGIYTVTVTDQNSCTATAMITIMQPNELVVNLNTDAVSCPGVADGVVRTTVSGGTAPFTYQWNDPAAQTAATATNLMAGNYTVTVTDANGCIKMQSITVTTANGFDININKIDANCTNGSLGTATASLSNGVAPYTYQWNDANQQTTETASNLEPGTYTVLVTDANGCTKSATVTIELIGQLDLTISKNDVTCPNRNDGFASVVVNNGTAPFQYLWSNNASTTSIDGLSAGAYSVTVTDSNNCTGSINLSIESPNAIVATINTIDASCQGSMGSASVEIIGGTAPYTYLWNDASMQTTATATQLPAGNYTVQITDANGCTTTQNATINDGANITINTEIIAPTCRNGQDGAATAIASGGQMPYTYLWNDPNQQTTATAIGLTAGDYAVTVTDANGCMAFGFASIETTDGLTLTVTGTNIDCSNGTSGSATVTVTGGSAPYFYLWDDPNMQNTATVSNLAAGTYNVTVTDDNGCNETTSIVIQMQGNFQINFNITNITCSNENNGTATAVPTGGVAPYTYLWETGSTNAMISNLSIGNYPITVTDANGCISENTATIIEPSPLQLTVSGTNFNCTNGTLGTATASVTDGTTPYTYLWNDENAQTTPTATGLNPGIYTVIVTDSNGCSIQSNINIEAIGSFELNIIENNLSCPDANDGSATAMPTSGVAPYTYLWETGSTTAIISNLQSGSYSVTVTDANGCSAEGVANILNPAPLEVVVTTNNGDCSTGSMGTATANVSGGVLPYTYLWNDENAQTTQTATGLSAGTYTVLVTDSNGCIIEETFTLEMVNGLTVSTTKTNVSCVGDSDGTAQALVSGGTAPFSYLWSNNATTANLINLSVGIYTVTVTDINGCTGTSMVNIGQPNPIQVMVNLVDASCNGLAGQATASATGGTAPYSFQWNDPDLQNTATATDLQPGNYTVTVTDTNGCSASTTITVELSGNLVVNITASATSVCSGGSIFLSTNPTGNQYTYSWSATGGNFDNANAATPTYTMMMPGTYTISVQISDAQGCQGTAMINVTIQPQPSVSITPNNAGVCSGTPVQFSITPTAANYTYSWTASGGSFNNANSPTPTYTMLTPGTYTINVTVSHPEGCSAMASTTITIGENPSCSAGVVAQISARNAADGQASVNVFEGMEPYSFAWNNGDMTQMITGLGAGTYTVTVTDAFGCSCTSSVTMNNPAKLGNFVWQDLDRDGIQDANEPGIPNVSVTLSGSNVFGNMVNATTNTDASGMYMFDGLMAGDYKVTFATPTDYTPTNANAGNNDAIDSDADPITGMTQTVSLNYGDYNQTLDAGFYSLFVNIGDYVWNDFDRDGIQDANEGGIPNVLVNLHDLGFDQTYGTNDDVTIMGTYTDFTGHYLFTNVPAGKYVIEFHPFTIPNGYIFTTANQGGNDALDSDADELGLTPMFMVVEGQMDDLTFDAGVYQKCSNLTDGGIIDGDEIVCGPGADPSLITNVQFPSGGFGDIEYLWMMSINTPVFNGPNDPNWQVILGETGPEYDPTPIFGTTYYARCSRRECCTTYFEANIVTKTVSDVPSASIQSGPTNACTQEVVSYTATFAGNSTSYTWNFGADAIPSTYVGRIVPEVYWTSQGNKTVTLTTNLGGCESTATRTVQVTDCFTPLGQIQGLVGQVMAEEAYIMLKWETTAEPFSSNFIIERADIEQNKFYTLDLMEGHGGMETNSYQLKDTHPLLGHNYYRIKHMDKLGNYVFSETINVFWQPKTVKDIHIFPNPFRENTTLQLLDPLEEEGTIQIVSAYGQVLEVLPLAANTHQMKLDFSTYPKGMYVLYICYNGYRKLTYRLFKTDDK